MRQVWKRRGVWRSATVLALACLLTATLVQPASAAVIYYSLPGAQADLTFSWGGAYQINGVRLTLHDTACNASPVEGEVELMTGVWPYPSTDTRINSKGCGTSQSWYWSYIKDPRGGKIFCVRVWMYTNGYSGYSLCADNPST